MTSFRSFVEDFNNNRVGQVSGLPLEFLLFFLSSTNKRVCIEVDRSVVENISVLLQDDIGGSVGCFLKPRNLLDGFENLYNTMSNLSTQALSSGRNMRLCFIETGLDKASFILRLLGSQSIILSARIRPCCRSPILIVPVCKVGASMIPLDEFPITPSTCLRTDR